MPEEAKARKGSAMSAAATWRERAKSGTSFFSKLEGQLGQLKADDQLASSLVLVVSDMQERQQLALWQQGNEAMYTQANLDARCALRHDPIVSAQLRNWWKTT